MRRNIGYIALLTTAWALLGSAASAQGSSYYASELEAFREGQASGNPPSTPAEMVRCEQWFEVVSDRNDDHPLWVPEEMRAETHEDTIDAWFERGVEQDDSLWDTGRENDDFDAGDAMLESGDASQVAAFFHFLGRCTIAPR